jgi:hypothetical protein
MAVAAATSIISALPQPADAQSVPVRVIRFEDIAPRGAVITSNFEGIGFDNAGKVYVTLCDAEEDVPGRGNCFVFSWDPVTGARRYYDNYLAASDRVGNLGPNEHWPNRETIVKGHTHLSYMNGMMWMGSMNAHGYQTADLPKHRGVHIYALDLATGRLVDHADAQPKGVFHENGGTYTMAVVPEDNLVLSIGVPNCTIVKYNPTTGAVTKTPGAPREDVAQLSGRDMVVMAGKKLLYQCGSGSTPFGLYDIATNATEVLDFRIDNPISLGYVTTRDKQTAYINSSTYIYKFDLRTKTGTRIGSLHPDATNRQSSPVNLSVDEKKLYYVLNMDGPEPSPYIMDLYEYNLETNTRTRLMSLKPTMGENAKLSGSHMMAANGKLYLTFNGRTGGIVEIDLSDRTGPPPTGTVAQPSITPNGGTFTTTQSVTLASATAGAAIRYSLDGSEPTTSSTLYAGAFTLSDTKTVKAKAFKTGMSASPTVSATFTKSGSGPVCGNSVCESGETTASCAADCVSTGGTCSHKYPSGSAAPGAYGASWDVFSTARELLIKTNCPTTLSSLTLTIGRGDANQAVYRDAYTYRPDLSTVSPWQKHTLTGTVFSGPWLTGMGTAPITAPASLSATAPMYIVGYVCTNRSGAWKCGCADASCTTGNWQLQAIQ